VLNSPYFTETSSANYLLLLDQPDQTIISFGRLSSASCFSPRGLDSLIDGWLIDDGFEC